ncbi:hypothetical protein Mgra_00004027 [Meloidogyne graminicola]|uniref:Uncharacterized protein n=1 Tax=Meloidogyne graminicola TaxID=189291 RepID=A0A8S9ZSJ8_9BILA|nr:hypothetical protein Mgra_00004027 [Meloidogyne graminicola]
MKCLENGKADIGNCVNQKCPDKYECNEQYKCCYIENINLTQISQKTDDFINKFRKILQINRINLNYKKLYNFNLINFPPFYLPIKPTIPEQYEKQPQNWLNGLGIFSLSERIVIAQANTQPLDHHNVQQLSFLVELQKTKELKTDPNQYQKTSIQKLPKLKIKKITKIKFKLLQPVDVLGPFP